MGNVWDKFISDQDAKIYTEAGYGEKQGLGQNPALIIVDVMYGFTGEKGVKDNKYPGSCAPVSWESIPFIQKLLGQSRKTGIPVFHTVMEGSKNYSNKNVGVKGNFYDQSIMLEGEKGSEIIEELKPISGEAVISKKKPSSFFGTMLSSELIKNKIDSVIITGCSTSGCVRATVIDAFSYNYQVVIPEECVFDRNATSHAINLFDMQQKYADILSTEKVIKAIET